MGLSRGSTSSSLNASHRKMTGVRDGRWKWPDGEPLIGLACSAVLQSRSKNLDVKRMRAQMIRLFAYAELLSNTVWEESVSAMQSEAML